MEIVSLKSRDDWMLESFKKYKIKPSLSPTTCPESEQKTIQEDLSRSERSDYAPDLSPASLSFMSWKSLHFDSYCLSDCP